jgi:radical SAM protein with 4Fe4S-binding SPASM domain
MMNCIKDMADLGVKVTYYAGEGEPTLHKDLAKFISYGKSLGMSQAISTNGESFDKQLAEKILPHLSWIRFSIDAGTAKTHAAIHGVTVKSYDKILKNIKDAVDIKQANDYKVDIGVQLILMPDNINEIEILAKWCKLNGVDNFQVKPAHNHPNSSYTPEIYKFVEQSLHENLEKLQDDKFTIIVRTKSAERITQEKKYRECHAFHFYINLDAKGWVMPCNVFFGDLEYTFGNIYENSFKQIWSSPRRLEIIENIRQLKFCNCKDYRCRLDVLNRYLDRVKYPEINDEFI